MVKNVFTKCPTETVIHQSQSERKALSLASPRNNMAALLWPPPHTTNKHWTGLLSFRLWAWIENICASLASVVSLSAVIWLGLLFTRASQCKYTFLEEHEFFVLMCQANTHNRPRKSLNMQAPHRQMTTVSRSANIADRADSGLGCKQIGG